VYGRNRPAPESFWDDEVAQVDFVRLPSLLLSRSEEIDVENGFPYHRSLQYDLDIGRRPILNGYVAILRETLEEFVNRRSARFQPAPLWPGDATFAVVLSHDVDVISATGFRQAVRHGINAITGKNQSRRERFRSLFLAAEQAMSTIQSFGDKDPAWNFERWIEAESEYGFRSTFYVAATEDRQSQDPSYSLTDSLVYEGEKITVAELFAQLAGRDWEVALHGSIGTHRSARALKAERERLAAAIGSSVDGIRQHYLKFDYPETWQCHEHTGMKYDSSLGFNRDLGHRAGLAFPFRPYDCQREQVLDFLELPISLQDTVPCQFKYAGRDRALERCKRVLDEIAATRGLVTLLWHPYTRHHPHWPEPLEIYEDLLEYIATCDAYVGTATEVSTWWREREAWITGKRESLPTADSIQ
jgi:hypothetical protein